MLATQEFQHQFLVLKVFVVVFKTAVFTPGTRRNISSKAGNVFELPVSTGPFNLTLLTFA